MRTPTRVHRRGPGPTVADRPGVAAPGPGRSAVGRRRARPSAGSPGSKLSGRATIAASSASIGAEQSAGAKNAYYFRFYNRFNKQSDTVEWRGDDQRTSCRRSPAALAGLAAGSGARGGARARARGGYDAVQLRSISDRTGVSSDTIYRYFGSRDRLISVAVRQWLEREYIGVAPTWLEGPTPAEQILSFGRHVWEVWERNPNMLETFVRAAMAEGAIEAASPPGPRGARTAHGGRAPRRRS